jgi:uncharacterized protein (TIGR00251 family)
MFDASENGCVIRLLIQPKASKTEVIGPFGEPPRLKLRVMAPPVEGAANAAVLEFLAKKLGVAKNKVHLIRGEQSRLKDFLVQGLSPAHCQGVLLPVNSAK